MKALRITTLEQLKALPHGTALISQYGIALWNGNIDPYKATDEECDPSRVLLIHAAAMTVLHIPGPAEHAATECSCTWNTLGSYWMKDLDCPYHASVEHQEDE